MIDKMKIAEKFFLDDQAILTLSQRFCSAIEAALAGKQSSLSRLDSCMHLPSGNEQGVFLALDFGGTNVRVSRVRLMGKGCYVIDKKVSHPLYVKGHYDYISAHTTKEALFDFLADCISEVALPGIDYRLGHTFSFATAQHGPGDAAFISWSKEMNVSGMDGMLINELLRQALQRKQMTHIEPVALVNDTTAALLAAAYQQENTNVAVICGTGFNMCYYEPACGTIINLEAGDYQNMVRTVWDDAVDDASEHPGVHRFEKMMSGRYLGELFCRCAQDYVGSAQHMSCTTEELNHFISLEENKAGQLFLSRLWNRIISEQDVRALRTIASALFVRSSQLAGGACAGVLRHLYPDGTIPEQMIAVEGSVLEKVIGSQAVFGNSLRLCFAVDEEGWIRPVPIKTSFVQNGPSIGAAVAAAMQVL